MSEEELQLKFMKEQTDEIKFSCRLCEDETEMCERTLLWIKECASEYRLWWESNH